MLNGLMGMLALVGAARVDSVPAAPRVHGVVQWAYGPQTRLYYVDVGAECRVWRGVSLVGLVSPENRYGNGAATPLQLVTRIGVRVEF